MIHTSSTPFPDPNIQLYHQYSYYGITTRLASQ